MTDYKLAQKSIVDELAQFIRQADGNNKMGAGSLAEKICERFHVADPAAQGVGSGPLPAPDVTQLVEVLTELCDEIDKHEIHAAISKTSISWFKRKARAVLAAHHIKDNGNG